MSGTQTTAARVCRQTGWRQTPQAVLPGPSMALGALTGTTRRQSPLVSHHTPTMQCLPHLDRHKAGEQRPSLQLQDGEAHTRPQTRSVYFLAPKKRPFSIRSPRAYLKDVAQMLLEEMSSDSDPWHRSERKDILGHTGKLPVSWLTKTFPIALFPNVANGHAYQRL